MPILPDTKNWTWVVERPCPECGLDASAIPFRALPDLLRANARDWPDVLRRADARERPDDATWSPLEYGAHVRDVFTVFDGRFRLMLEQDDPTFENWDQDATAEQERYREQDPERVATELLAAGETIARTLEAVPEHAMGRTALRTDGSRFTVESLGRYLLHDPVHHLHDVSR